MRERLQAIDFRLVSSKPRSSPVQLDTGSTRWSLRPCSRSRITHAGKVWRGVEVCAVRLLLAFGGRRRVERLSLGIAQIQPCRVPGDQPLHRRVDRLLARSDAVDLCAQIVAGIHGDQNLHPEASTWSGENWAAIGFGYGGDRIYGPALSGAYVVLKLRAGVRAPSVR